MVNNKTWYEDLFARNSYIDIYGPDDTSQGKLEVAQLIQLLNLKPSQSVLDLCCGYGRHAIPFAEFGFKVTGIDLSEVQIAEAKQRAKSSSAESKLNFLVDDARNFELNKKFDIITNLFLSFGYDDHASNWEMLSNFAKHLKPKGKLIMDFWNRDKEVIEVINKPNVWEKIDKYLVLKEFNYDPISGYIEWSNTVVHPKGKIESWSHRVMAYTCSELIRMFNSVGLDVTHVYGDFDGSAFCVDSPTLILVGQPY